MSPLPVGKLPPTLLSRILPSLDTYALNRVVVPPQIGEDAAVIDFGESYLIAKTDPITFATDEIGWYLVCVNGNDIATMGGVPKWLLVTLLLPENTTTPTLVTHITDQIKTACQSFQITLCGGHTEITYGLDRPIAIGQMLGEVPKDRLVRSADARVGDDLILTKGIGIEATSIIARERELELKTHFSAPFINSAKDYLSRLSILKEAQIAVDTGGVRAMHDPTEGGIVTAVRELATAAEVGAEVWINRLIVPDETSALCGFFDLDPLGVISSGALLIATEPSRSRPILEALTANQIQANLIGKLLPPQEGLWLKKGTDRQPLPTFQTDEITKIFAD